MKVFIYNSLLSLVCAVGVVGCGGESVQEQVGEQNANAQEDTHTELSTKSNLPADAPIMKVAVTSVYAPYCFLDEKGKSIGYAIDLFTAVGEAEGMKAEFILLPWPKYADALFSGKADVGFSVGTIGTDEQKSKTILSNPYLRSRAGYGVKADSLYQDAKALTGKPISIQATTKFGSLLEKYNPSSKVVEEASTYVAYSDVMMGKTEATFNDESLIAYQASMFPEYPIRFLPMKQAGFASHYALASDENKKIITTFNSGFDKIKSNGKYQAINEKWFGESASDMAIQ